MAKKSNGRSGEVLSVLLKMIERDEDTLDARLRVHVRQLFDEAMKEHDNFERMLIDIYTAGMQAAIDARPRRKRVVREPATVA